MTRSSRKAAGRTPRRKSKALTDTLHAKVEVKAITSHYDKWLAADEAANELLIPLGAALRKVRDAIKAGKLIGDDDETIKSFSAFIKNYVPKIGRTTVYRAIAIENGQGEKIHKQESARQNRHKQKLIASGGSSVITDNGGTKQVLLGDGSVVEEPKVSGNDVDTDTSAAQRKAAYQAPAEPAPTKPKAVNAQPLPGPKPGSPEDALAQFKVACDLWLPKCAVNELSKARVYVSEVADRLEKAAASARKVPA